MKGHERKLYASTVHHSIRIFSRVDKSNFLVTSCHITIRITLNVDIKKSKEGKALVLKNQQTIYVYSLTTYSSMKIKNLKIRYFVCSVFLFFVLARKLHHAKEFRRCSKLNILIRSVLKRADHFTNRANVLHFSA